MSVELSFMILIMVVIFLAAAFVFLLFKYDMKKKSFDENESNSTNSNTAKSNNMKSDNFKDSKYYKADYSKEREYGWESYYDNKYDKVEEFITNVLFQVNIDFCSASYLDKFSTGTKISFKYVFENGTVVLVTEDNYLAIIQNKKGKRAKLSQAQVLYVLKYFKSCVNVSTSRPRSSYYSDFNTYYDNYSANSHSKFSSDYSDYIAENFKNQQKKYTPEQLKYQELYKKLKYTYDRRIEQIQNISKYDPERISLMNESNVVKRKMDSAYEKSGLK